MEALKPLVGLLILLVVASCDLILGEHELFEERQSCEEDNDCDVKNGEICDSSYDGVCRKACEEDHECGPRADCNYDTCDDDLGTPCDPENSGTCGSEECLDRDENKNLVLGYCTKSCSDIAVPPELCPDDDYGNSYVCPDSVCVLKDGS
ncbi:MAG: hypothetical protein DRI90_23715 [Deltaproteobacteria bacterium]|nr:MAG: hypothetical protein DRI90_23715 [Deltaproteobacteria bacterium]